MSCAGFFRGLGRGSRRITILGAVLLASSVLAQAAPDPPTQDLEFFELDDESAGLLNSFVGGDHPEPEWGRIGGGIAGNSLRSLAPLADPGSSAQALHVTQSLIPETVLASQGAIGRMYELGVLHAVEFDLFPDDPILEPGAAQHLGVTGVLRGFDDEGIYGVLGSMYCYDEAQYQARIGVLTTLMGGAPPEQRTLWLAPLIHSTQEGASGMQLSGTANRFEGYLKANSDLLLGGLEQCVLDTIRHAGDLIVSGEDHSIAGSTVQAASPGVGAQQPLSAYVAMATSFTGDLTVVRSKEGGLKSSGGTALSGVVYATGTIRVLGSGMTGSVTFLSEQGIEILGDGNELTPAVDDLLAAVTGTGSTALVEIAGDGNRLTGLMLGAAGALEISGSSNLITGQLVANTIEVTGSWNTLSDGLEHP